MSFRRSVPLFLGRVTGKMPPKLDAAFWRYLRLPKSIPVWRSHGQTRSGDSATLISSGIEPRADYFPALFFENDFEVESLGHLPVLSLGAKIKKLELSADLLALRMDRIQARLCFNRSYLRVPEWVRSSLKVPAEIQELASGHNSLRQDLRLIRKHGYTVTQSHSTEDFDAFYQSMYLPHGRGRHGPHAHLRSRDNLHEAFRRGLLLIIKKDGNAISGIVVEKVPSAISFAGIGVLGGDEQLLKIGALAAAYYFGLLHAREVGFTKVDLGGTRPCCTDSLLRYKKKWGAVVEPRPLHTNDYIMRWRSTNSAVSAMLAKFPLIVRDQGQLSALTLSDRENTGFEIPPGLYRKIEIPPMTDLEWPIGT